MCNQIWVFPPDSTTSQWLDNRAANSSSPVDKPPTSTVLLLSAPRDRIWRQIQRLPALVHCLVNGLIPGPSSRRRPPDGIGAPRPTKMVDLCHSERSEESLIQAQHAQEVPPRFARRNDRMEAIFGAKTIVGRECRTISPVYNYLQGSTLDSRINLSVEACPLYRCRRLKRTEFLPIMVGALEFLFGLTPAAMGVPSFQQLCATTGSPCCRGRG